MLNDLPNAYNTLKAKQLHTKYKKLVSLQKAISNFKNGFCVKIDGEVFFAKQSIESSTLKSILNKQFIYTQSYYKYNLQNTNNNLNFDGCVTTSDHLTYKNSSKNESLATKLAFYASMLPQVIKCDEDDFIKNIFEPINISSQDIEDFELDRYYDLSYLSHARVQNESSADTFLYAFQSLFSGETHYAIVVGSPSFEKNVKVRVHSSCYTGDLMHSLRCDCKYQLHNAIKFLAKQDGGGVIVYLMQEGRGIGLASKLMAYSYQQNQGLNTIDSNLVLGFESEHRNFYPAKLILDYFKIKDVELITNNPAKVKQLTDLGINVTDSINFHSPQNQYNKDYIDTKREKMGHENI
jgi:GTP cyclohydrolase II